MHEGHHDILEGVDQKDKHHTKKGLSLDLPKTVGIVVLVVVLILLFRFILV